MQSSMTRCTSKPRSHCALIQTQCPTDEYDLCMESLAERVGEFGQAILVWNREFPDGISGWCGRSLVASMCDRSPTLETFACACAFLWRPAFAAAREGDQEYCKERAINMFRAAKDALGANLISIVRQYSVSPAVIATATVAPCCFNFAVSPIIVVVSTL